MTERPLVVRKVVKAVTFTKWYYMRNWINPVTEMLGYCLVSSKSRGSCVWDMM